MQCSWEQGRRLQQRRHWEHMPAATQSNSPCATWSSFTNKTGGRQQQQPFIPNSKVLSVALKGKACDSTNAPHLRVSKQGDVDAREVQCGVPSSVAERCMHALHFGWTKPCHTQDTPNEQDTETGNEIDLQQTSCASRRARHPRALVLALP